MIIPAYCLTNISRLQCMQEEPSQWLVVSQSLGDRPGNSERSMCPEYKKHITRDDKMAQETILDILKEFTTSNRQSIGQIMYVKKLCKARGKKKKRPIRLKETIIKAHIWLGIISVLCSQSGKSCNSWDFLDH